MNEEAVTTVLEMRSTKGKLIADLTFSNNTEQVIFLDKYTICLDKELTSRVFEVADKDGNKIQYIGKMIKRKPSKDDFIKLEPEKSISTSVTLDDSYEFRKGEKEYAITYDAINHSFGDQKMIEMTSNKVVIKHTK